MSCRLRTSLVAVLTLSSTVFAQSPAEIADWLKSIKATVGHQPPTAELVAKARDVSFTQVAKDTLVIADLAKLKGMPGLREVGLGNKAGSDAAVAELVKVLPNLEGLSVSGSAVTDAAFVEIAKLTKLRDLKTFDTGITSVAMISVAKLPALKTLDISKTKVGDEGLEALKASPLTNLSFNNMKGVTKKGVAAIAAMPNLTNLVVQFAEINAEVEELAKAPKLKDITFMSSTLDDTGGVHLAKLKTLEALFLWSTKVTDKTMEAIAGLPLRTLYISNTPVTDAGMKSLAKIKTLETLWFDRTAIGDSGLAHFAAHPAIRSLKADESKVTDGCVATLVTLPKFSSIDVKKTAFSEAGAEKVKAKFPKGRVFR